MQKPDEIALWNAVIAYKPTLEECDVIPAWTLGTQLGMHEKRIRYLCSKWMRQHKWIQLGSMSGTLKGLELYNESLLSKRHSEADRLRHCIANGLLDTDEIPHAKAWIRQYG